MLVHVVNGDVYKPTPLRKKGGRYLRSQGMQESGGVTRSDDPQIGWIALTLAIAAAIIWGGFGTGSIRQLHGCCSNVPVEAAADTGALVSSSVSDLAG